MECPEIKSLLSEYIDGTLDAETKELVDQHVLTCGHCRKELASLRALVQELGSLESVEPPKDFLVQLHKRLDKRSRFSILVRSLFLPFRIKIPLQVAGAVAMAVLVFSVFHFQREEFKVAEVPVVTLKEEVAKKQADNMAGTEKRALETRPRPALEKTALKRPPREARPIEVALLLRKDLAQRAYGPGKAAEMPLRSEKEQFETFGAGRALPSVDVEGEEKSGGHGEEDKARSKLPEERDPLVGLKHVIRSVHGKVLSVEFHEETKQPDALLAQIPASRWGEFREQLESLGDLRIPAEPDIEKGKENLQVRIRLLPQNQGGTQ
jgi:anti-sigma factor RsiW